MMLHPLQKELTMKAAILRAFGSPLAVETMPDPVLGTGEVIVDVVATRVLSYANEVFSGMRKYLIELPMVPGPGAIGRVRAVGPDADPQRRRRRAPERTLAHRRPCRPTTMGV